MQSNVRLTLPLLRAMALTLPLGLYSCLTMLHERWPFHLIPGLPPVMDAVLGFALALLVAFRINRAYERWWEARTLWGSLVNVSRNLAVKIRELTEADEAERRTSAQMISAFCYSLKDQLREERDVGVLEPLSPQREPQHLPLYVAQRIYRQLESLRQSGKMSEEKLRIIDREARELMNVCGACERIKTTQISISWRLLTVQSIAVYLLIFPWGVWADFGPWTVPITMIVAYFLMAGEAVAHAIEEPFKPHADNLDLDRICRVIKKTTSEVLEN